MPRVPVYENTQVKAQPLRVSQDIRAPAGAFGANVGAAFEQAGQQMGQVTSLIDRRMVTMQEEDNRAAAKQADTDFDTAILQTLHGAPDPTQPGGYRPGYDSLKGEAAITGLTPTIQQLREQKNTISSRLTNPEQQRLFNESADARINSALGTLSAHAARERTSWHNGISEARLGNAVTNATTYNNDPGRIAEELDRGRTEIADLGQRNGWSAEEIQFKQSKWVSSTLETVIGTRAVDDPLGAQTFFEKNRSLLDGPTQEKLARSLKPHVDTENARRIVADITGTATTQPADGAGASTGASTGASSEKAPAGDGAAATVETLWPKVRGRESGGQQFAPDGKPLVSPKDAIGVSQIQPATARETAEKHGIAYDENKLRTDPAYNEQLGKLRLGDMLERFGGNKSLALAAYNAGPGMVEDWIAGTNKTGKNGAGIKLGDPRTGEISEADWAAKIPFKETLDYVAAIGGGSTAGKGGSTGGALPDLDSLIARADAATVNMSLDVQIKTRTLITSWYHQRSQTVNLARTELRGQLRDLQAAAADGRDVSWDEARIRNTLPGPEADAWLTGLDRARLDGRAKLEVTWATPAEITARRAQNERDLQSPENYQQKAAGADAYNRQVAWREKALHDDPALYVAQSPALKALSAAIDPQNPGPGTDAYVRAALAEQERLGVPEQDRRILSDSQAAALVHTLTTKAPGEADIGRGLEGLAQTYGAHWPEVFGELVKAKLPGEYQVLAAMDAPGQTVARGDLQRVLSFAAEKGGAAKVKEAAPPEEARIIEKDVDSGLADFRATVAHNEGGMKLYDTVRDAVRLLAFGYAMQGKSGSAALEQAIDGVLNAKYDFDGTMRVPKGMLPLVHQATTRVVGDLTVADLAPVAGNPDLTPEQRQGIVLDAARRGTWVPNADDSGLVLMAQYRDGAFLPVRRADGHPVEMRFSEAVDLTAARSGDGPSPLQSSLQGMGQL